MTRSGVIAGTPQYMSPEQARGDAVDARSDLFSLGSVMYAMCTARPPFRAETSFGILRRITDTEPRPIREVNPNIPEWLDRVIQRLLAKSLDDRIQTADHVARLFEQCLAHVQQPTIIELPEECRPVVRTSQFSFRSWRVRGTMIAIGCLAVFGIYSASRPKLDQRELNPVSESTPAMGSDEPTAEWGALQSEIENFDAELQPAEAEMEEIWSTK
jgi:serine/threonine protein kinase